MLNENEDVPDEIGDNVDPLMIHLVWRGAREIDQRDNEEGRNAPPEICDEIVRHIVETFENLDTVRQRRRLGIPVRIRRYREKENLEPPDWHSAASHYIVYLGDDHLAASLGPGQALEPFHQKVRSHVKNNPKHAKLLIVGLTTAGFEIENAEHIQTLPLVGELGSLDKVSSASGLPNKAMRKLLLTILGGVCRLARQLLYETLPESERIIDHDTGRRMDPASNLQVFLSHTRRQGRATVLTIRDRMDEFNLNGAGLEPYLDSDGTRVGENFKKDFRRIIADGMFIAIQTEDYSTRSFCRWEMMTAKREHRPILVVQMLREAETRTFPYSGNTPLRIPDNDLRRFIVVARKDERGRDEERVIVDPAKLKPGETEKEVSDVAKAAVDRIMIEMFSEAVRFYVFATRAWATARSIQMPNVVVLSRPPELIDLAELQSKHRSHSTLKELADMGDEGRKFRRDIIYPDPPLDVEEAGLVRDLALPYGVASLSQMRVQRHFMKVARQPEYGASLTGPGGKLVRVGISAGSDCRKELDLMGFFTWMTRRNSEEDVEPHPTTPTWQVMSEIAAVAAQMRARIIFGGDLRAPDNLTDRLFHAVGDAYRLDEAHAREPVFINLQAFCAWHGWSKDGKITEAIDPVVLHRRVSEMQSNGTIVLALADNSLIGLRSNKEGTIRVDLGLESTTGTLADRLKQSGENLSISEEDMSRFLHAANGGVELPVRDRDGSYTEMRKSMSEFEHVRVVVGGKVGPNSTGFPGIMEEALYAARKGKLVIPIGGFGGAAHDVAVALGLVPDWDSRISERRKFQRVAEKREDKLHPNYQFVFDQLKEEGRTYLDRISKYEVTPNLQRLATTTSMSAISEHMRVVLLKCFPTARAGADD